MTKDIETLIQEYTPRLEGPWTLKVGDLIEPNDGNEGNPLFSWVREQWGDIGIVTKTANGSGFVEVIWAADESGKPKRIREPTIRLIQE